MGHTLYLIQCFAPEQEDDTSALTFAPLVPTQSSTDMTGVELSRESGYESSLTSNTCASYRALIEPFQFGRIESFKMLLVAQSVWDSLGRI